MNIGMSLAVVSILLTIFAAAFGEGPAKPFEAKDVNGRTVRLSDYLSSKRILLVFNPAVSYLDDLRRKSSDLAKRDMQVITVYNKEASVNRGSDTFVWLNQLQDVTGEIFQLYKVPLKETHSFLIGKDTGIKQDRKEAIALADLFKTIDGMPMRRREAGRE